MVAMLEQIVDKLHDTRMLAMVLAGIAAMATVMTLAMPFLSTDGLDKRMRAVAIEREKIRQRERERMARGEKVALRSSPKQYIQRVVEQFNLSKWVGQEEARAKLIQAGYRGQAPYVVYLFFRMVAPIVTLASSLVYLFVLHRSSTNPMTDQDRHVPCSQPTCRHATAVSCFSRTRSSTAKSPSNAHFPDALDLLLICVESGMSIEVRIPSVSARKSVRSRSRSPRS